MAGFADPDPAFVLNWARSRTRMVMEIPGWSDISRKYEKSGEKFNPHDIKTSSQAYSCTVKM